MKTSTIIVLLICGMLGLSASMSKAKDTTDVVTKDWGSYAVGNNAIGITVNEPLSEKKVGFSPEFINTDFKAATRDATPEAQKILRQLWDLPNCFSVRWNTWQIIVTKIPAETKPWPKDIDKQIDKIMDGWYKTVKK